MLPNSRIVPPPSTNDNDRYIKKNSPYTQDSSLKEGMPTQYLSRIVPPPTTSSLSQGTSLHKQQQQHYSNATTNSSSTNTESHLLPPIKQQQQIKRKPLTDTTNLSNAQLPNHNSYQWQQSLSSEPVTRHPDLSLQSPPLSPPPSSSTSSTMTPNHDSFLDPSFFQAQDRSYSTEALTAEDAKKKPASRKGFGKFFKKLGMSVDDDEAPQVRSIGNVVSVKSSRSYHNIPLVPPPPPPAPVSKQPDDLIASISPRQRAQIITNSSNINTSLQNTLPSHTTPVESTQQSLYQKPALLIPVVPKDHPSQPSSVTSTLISNTPTPTTTNKPTASVYQETLKDHTIIDRTSSIISSSRSPSPSPTPTPRWSVSTRKSSVSYSIYSTFGSDSFTSQEALDSATTTSTSASSSSCLSLPNNNKDHLQRLQTKQQDFDDDLSQIVTNNVQRRNQRRVVSGQDQEGDQDDNFNITKKQPKGNSHGNTLDMNTNTPTQSARMKVGQELHNSGKNDTNHGDYDTDDDTEDDDDDDDIFVDATGYSQDDMERERFDSRLSKRLSGGHYGSAGGLLFSLEAAQRRPKQQQQKHRHSNGNNAPLPKIPPLPVDHHTVPTTVIATETNKADETTLSNTKSPTDTLFDDSQLSSFWNENPSLVLNEFGSGFLSPSASTHSSKSIDESIHTTDTHEAKEMAELLWNEDESFVTKDHMAEWLGTRKSLNSLVLVHYLDYFDFATLRLDDAFRKLCGKLYFKAEAQQIDRILDVFAKRYWKCNLQSIFGSSDVVYAVVYSLLLLNTDLHVAQGNYARMTKQAFVKNTMSTIHDQSSVKVCKTWEINMESYLKDLYNSVKQHQILQPLSERPVDSGSVTLDKRSSIIGGRRVLEMKRNMGAIIRKSMHEPNIVVEESESITSPVRSPSSPSSTSQQRKRDSISSIGSSASSLRNSPSLLTPHSQPQHSMSGMNASGLFLDLNQSQYMKEGILVRKHLLENATQKAKHRDWRECFSVVGDGELKMYTIQGGYQQASNKVSSSDMDRRSLLRSSGIGFNSMTDSLTSKTTGTTQEASSNGNKWGAFSQLIGTISLSHSLANVLPPPGYNRQRSFVFAIQQSHGGVYLFQAGSQALVNEWASTCNYWAARQSKEPLPGGVSNMEYGWGNCLHDVILNLDEDDLLRQEQPIGVLQRQQKSHQQNNHQEYGASLSSTTTAETMIYDWRPPAPPMVSSNLNERDQHNALQKHLNSLNSDINEHREIKKKMMVKFPSKHPQHAKVMSNWELKSKYLLHEIIKYQNYCDALEKSIFNQDKNDIV